MEKFRYERSGTKEKFFSGKGGEGRSELTK